MTVLIQNPFRLQAAMDSACISEEARLVLKHAFPKDRELHEYLDNEMATCPVGVPRGKKRTKRAPSEYQKFVGQCLREKMAGKGFDSSGSALKACAADWRKKKGK